MLPVMDWKRFLLYYIPMAVIIIIFGKMFPDWVDENYILYYIVLVGCAFIAEQLARIKKKKK